MTKGIIVVEIPESCSRCPLFSDIYNDMTCRGNGRTIDYPYPKDFKQDWCPIREMPGTDQVQAQNQMSFLSPWKDWLKFH